MKLTYFIDKKDAIINFIPSFENMGIIEKKFMILKSKWRIGAYKSMPLFYKLLLFDVYIIIKISFYVPLGRFKYFLSRALNKFFSTIVKWHWYKPLIIITKP